MQYKMNTEINVAVWPGEPAVHVAVDHALQIRDEGACLSRYYDIDEQPSQRHLNLKTVCPTTVCREGRCGRKLRVELHRVGFPDWEWPLCRPDAGPLSYARMCHRSTEVEALRALHGIVNLPADVEPVPSAAQLQEAAYASFAAAFADAGQLTGVYPGGVHDLRVWRRLLETVGWCSCHRQPGRFSQSGQYLGWCRCTPLPDVSDLVEALAATHPDLMAEVSLPAPARVGDVPCDSYAEDGEVHAFGSQMVLSLLGLSNGPTRVVVPMWVALVVRQLLVVRLSFG